MNWGFDLGYIYHSGIMPRKRSLLERQLDDSSSDDEDSLILGTVAIVDTFANKKTRWLCPRSYNDLRQTRRTREDVSRLFDS